MSSDSNSDSGIKDIDFGASYSKEEASQLEKSAEARSAGDITPSIVTAAAPAVGPSHQAHEASNPKMFR
jgi:hypothetical protein